MGETIKIRDVPEETKEYLEQYKQQKGWKWNGMAIKLEELLREEQGDPQ